jgi:hypothetical protein
MKFTLMNSKPDFNSNIFDAIHLTSEAIINQSIELINSNNRLYAEITIIDLSIVTTFVNNYFIKNFNYSEIIVDNNDSLFSQIEIMCKKIESDTAFLEKLKQIISENANPLLYGYEFNERNFISTRYESLSYLSIDANIILNEIDLKIISPFVEDKLIKSSNRTSSIYLPEFDTKLYSSIISHPQLMHNITWREFEYLLAKILASFEYEIELQKGTKDGGIDIIAIKKSDIMGPHKYLIQAKKWKNKVGVEPVQRLAFLQNEHDVSKACLATTSTFTKGAWELARMHPWTLELKDYNGLLDWIKFASIR